MKKYAFAMKGEEVAATFDGNGKPFEGMVKLLESDGYAIKFVSEKEYRKEEAKEEYF